MQLKSEHKKLRALPQLPTEENNKESSSKLAKQGLRLSNFFRSVKFPRNKKIIQTAPIRIFGRELNDLVKATNQEGKNDIFFNKKFLMPAEARGISRKEFLGVFCNVATASAVSHFLWSF